jgi:hypothetical protein
MQNWHVSDKGGILISIHSDGWDLMGLKLYQATDSYFNPLNIVDTSINLPPESY